MYTHKYTYLYACTYAYAGIWIYTCMYMYTCIHIYISRYVKFFPLEMSEKKTKYIFVVSSIANTTIIIPYYNGDTYQ